MKLPWKPIKNLNDLPLGIEIMVCLEDYYCDFIRRAGSTDSNPDAWFYVYTTKQVQEHKLKAFTHYFIPRHLDNTVKKPIHTEDNLKAFKCTIEAGNPCYVETLLVIGKDKENAHKQVMENKGSNNVVYKHKLEEIEIDLTTPKVFNYFGWGHNDND